MSARQGQSAAISAPRIGVALGSGAARGLAHIPYIEAIDELGLRPAVIAGTSMGALIGAGWANGMTGEALREHAYSMLGTLQLIAGRLWTQRPRLKGVLQKGISIQGDALGIVNGFLPEAFAEDFAALRIPFKAVATDFHGWQPVVFESGPLRPALAASLAIPGLFKPVSFDGRLFLDGGVTNPLPIDCVKGADILIAVDVTGQPPGRPVKGEPNLIDTGIVATRIMTHRLTDYAVERHPPDIHVLPEVNQFGMFEFWRVREILAVVEADKDRFKRSLTAKLEEHHAGKRTT